MSAAEDEALGISTLEPTPPSRLRSDILRLYEDEYILHWETFLKDITLAPLGDPDSSLRLLNTLSNQANSPIKQLLTSVLDETRLTAVAEEEQPPQSEAQEAAMKAATKAATKAAGRLGRLARKGMQISSRI